MLLVALATPGAVLAHAFPDHSDPRVGHTVEVSPSEVRIWFDGAIEPVFSSMKVEDASGKRVDRDDAHVDPSDQRLLEVSVAALAAGAYQVEWSVVARDGHRTEGKFTFRVAPH
ncbi:MAG TPA: copper resistance CopC family protein [Candidatus Binatia bacterium]|jgi:methionine-rich copper-binding protein CopC